MNEKLKEEVAAQVALKKEAHEVVKKQRKKDLVSRPKAGAPTYAENQAAIKQVLAPVNYKKRAKELFEQVVSVNSESVYKRLLEKALDPEDRDSMAAIKLITDRLAPVSSFEENVGSSGAGKVVINISGLSNTQDVNVHGRVIDAEDVDV